MKRSHPNLTHSAFALLLLFIALPFLQSARAQYSHTLGGPGFDEGLEVGLDAEGNAYFIGNFADTLDFDPGPDTHLLRNNNTDVFVASYTPAGDMRFAFRLGGFLASKESAGDIAVAPDGSFVVTGAQPFGGIDFDPDPISERVRSGELFVAGYTGEGNVRFAVSPTGGQNTSSGKGHAITLDDAGNAYVTGAFATSLDFNPADTSNGIVPYEGATDVFVASYTSAGEYRYAYSFGGVGFDHGSGIAVDSEGNVFVAGLFSGDVFFDPQDTDNDGDKQLRTSINAVDIFLVSYDAGGHFRFAYGYKGTTGVDTDREIALSIDGADNVYLSGETHGTVHFDPEDADGDGDQVERTADPLGSAFLASYTPAGELRYATVLNGGPSVSTDVFTTPDGVSFITGIFSGDVDFDPGADIAVLSSRRGADVFVASYDAEGAYRVAFNLPSNGLSTGEGIAVDEAYNVVLTGGFTTDLDVAVESPEDWRTSMGQNDIFMARFSEAGLVRVGVAEESALPASFEASAPYPNPFTALTTFAVEAPAAQEVSIGVYDVLGRRVATVHEGGLSAGKHAFSWDGGREPAGMYFIRIANGVSSRVLRAVLVR